ncbi:MAG: hypothetical protein ACE5FT_04970 [Candidatus Nanoarchaeia archaeon]
MGKIRAKSGFIVALTAGLVTAYTMQGPAELRKAWDLEQQGQLEAAVSHYENAARYGVSNVSEEGRKAYRIAWELERSGDKDLLNDYMRAVEASPQSAMARFSAGDQFAKLIDGAEPYVAEDASRIAAFHYRVGLVFGTRFPELNAEYQDKLNSLETKK